MAKKSIRTERMKESFMALRREGKSIKEIAEMFSVSLYTVYSSLQEIADMNGVDRETLLYSPHKEHDVSNRSRNEKSSIDIESIRIEFVSIVESIDALQTKITKTVQEIQQQEDICYE